jgi:hypothetical protein
MLEVNGGCGLPSFARRPAKDEAPVTSVGDKDRVF